MRKSQRNAIVTASNQEELSYFFILNLFFCPHLLILFRVMICLITDKKACCNLQPILKRFLFYYKSKLTHRDFVLHSFRSANFRTDFCARYKLSRMLFLGDFVVFPTISLHTLAYAHDRQL